MDNNSSHSESAQIYVQQVRDPERYGVAELAPDGKVLSIEEKPINPKSSLAVTGLYIYPQDVYTKVTGLIRSKRNELEITDLNNVYLSEGRLHAHKLQRGTVWFDAGTPDALLETSNFVAAIQKHQSIQIGSPHEVAILKGWATDTSLEGFLDTHKHTEYGRYIQRLLCR